MLVTLLTEDFGLVRARAEGIRKPGSKLTHALQTLSETEVVILSGKDGWRLAGAVLEENWFAKLSRSGRLRAGRVGGLLLRLVQGESADARLFQVFIDFVRALPSLQEEEQDAMECAVALDVLRLLGLDDGPEASCKEHASIEDRRALIARINRGISASGL